MKGSKRLWCAIVVATVSSMPGMARPHLEEVVTLYTSDASSGTDDRLASLADFVSWKLTSKTLREVALYQTEPYEIAERAFQDRRRHRDEPEIPFILESLSRADEAPLKTVVPALYARECYLFSRLLD